MARGTAIKIGGVEYWLVYNAEAYFDVQEQIGDDVYIKIVSPGRDGWETAVAAAVILLEHGELCHRYLGYDAQKIPTADTIRAVVQPYDIVTFKNKILDAMNRGVRREVEPAEEIDEGLLELEKKTEIA